MSHEIIANEQRSVEQHLAELPSRVEWAKMVLTQVRRVAALPQGARILDVGAAAGGFLVGCTQLGYVCDGVEPWDEARRSASALAARVGIELDVVDGSAERIPFSNDTFDVVHASSVMEHVGDLDGSLAEANRVLKPGGVFWFTSSNSLCPIQSEIRGFPLFGWYPNGLKVSIMKWARDHRPALVGHSKTPAFNWLTPAQWRERLGRNGFRRIYDRWDLWDFTDRGIGRQMILRAIRSSRAIRLCADIALEGCAFAAIK